MASIIIGDYEYTYTVGSGEASVKVTDKSKSSYGPIQSPVEIDGENYNVTSVKHCFGGCRSLTASPDIPDTVIDMSYCFDTAIKLTKPPAIPSGVTNMEHCFNQCFYLTTAPAIPNGVVNMYACFNATKITNAPVIPSTVTDMSYCFGNNQSLGGNLIVLNNPTTYNRAFFGTSKAIRVFAIGLEAYNAWSTIVADYTNVSLPSEIPTGLSFSFGDYNYTTQDSETLSVQVRNISKTMYAYIEEELLINNKSCITSYMDACFKNCTRLETSPTIPKDIKSIKECFYNCKSLQNAPVLPSAVRNFSYCFYGCESLNGEVIINSTWNTDDTNANIDVFYGTKLPIYIIAGVSGIEDGWKNVANVYFNVHFEADDNPVPSLTYIVQRVASSGSEIPSETGEWAFIQATSNIYETILPSEWTNSFKSSIMTLDGVSVSPSWSRTYKTENKVTTVISKAWMHINDTVRHTFTLYIQDETKNDEDIIKDNKVSQTLKVLFTGMFATIDFLAGGHGVAIGTFATNALFDVAMPARFNDYVQYRGGQFILRGIFVDTQEPTSTDGEDGDIWLVYEE